jgi:ATP-binding cassette subfamily A (ABC1) protein 3
MFKRRVNYMKRSWLYLMCETVAPAAYILLIFIVIGGFLDNLFGSGDLQLSMAPYNQALKVSNPDFYEAIPVVVIPSGDLDNTSATWESGSLDSHGFASIITVGSNKYELKVIDLSSDEFAVSCDNDAAGIVKEVKGFWESRQNDDHEADNEDPGKCQEQQWGGRRRARRMTSFQNSNVFRALQPTSKSPGVLRACGLGGLETQEEFRDKNITNVEVIVRGYSCWLQRIRDTDPRAESTYGAIILHEASGGHVLLVNTTGVHAVPIMQNLRANAILQKVSPEDQIEVTFSQFERTPLELGSLMKNVLVIVSIILLSVAFAFPPPFFVAFIVEEKSAGVKGQLLVSGLRGINYWIANYIFDILPWSVAFCGITAVFWAYDLDFFFDAEVFRVYFAGMIAFVVHIIPFAYCLAQLFHEPATAIMVVLFSGMLLFVAYVFWIAWSFDGEGPDSFKAYAEWATPFLRTHPTFVFSEVMIVLQQLYTRFQMVPPEIVKDEDREACLQERSKLKNQRWDCAYGYWEWDACGGPICTSFVWGFALIFVVIVLEVLFQTPWAIFAMQKLRDHGSKVSVEADEEDDAVRQEAGQVNSGAKTGPIHVQGLRKTYVSANLRAARHTAVKPISWACDAGDVFGLLGVNGAGKTTLFQMLSGILVQNEGSVKIAGNDMLTSDGLRRARNGIGYCPQHNPLLGILSVREHLEMFGMLKGLAGRDLDEARDLWIAAMDLTNHQFKLAGNLSGGNKRKLCVAIAMIGDPEIILLDEPSAGMDPEARRFMWNIVAEIAQTRKQATVVLTTHSMEECEALCNKVTVMVNGAFRCFGTVREVKDLYGAGRQLTVKLESPTQMELDDLKDRWAADGLLVDDKSQTLATLGVEGVYSADEDANTLSKVISREKLAKWAEQDDAWLSQAVSSRVPPFPDTGPGSTATVTVLSEWYCNARNAKRLVAWVKQLDPGAEWVAWASTTFRFKLYGGGSLPFLFNEMYKNKKRLNMMEYAVSPTSLEQIFHAFAKEQTGSSEHEGVVYGNVKELALTELFSASATDLASAGPGRTEETSYLQNEEVGEM